MTKPIIILLNNKCLPLVQIEIPITQLQVGIELQIVSFSETITTYFMSVPYCIFLN